MSGLCARADAEFSVAENGGRRCIVDEFEQASVAMDGARSSRSSPVWHAGAQRALETPVQAGETALMGDVALARRGLSGRRAFRTGGSAAAGAGQPPRAGKGAWPNCLSWERPYAYSKAPEGLWRGLLRVGI
jgi:hypothetical protein